MLKKQLTTLAILTVFSVQAQINQPTHLNFGAGMSLVTPLGIPKSIYFAYGIQSSYLMEWEKGITQRGAIQTGAQLSFLALSMDAVLNSKNQLTTAPDSIKYASLNQVSIQIPFRYRVYQTNEKDRKFYQFGATLGYRVKDALRYRQGGTFKEETIREVNAFQAALTAGIGKRIKSKSVLYIDYAIWLTPYFKQAEASNLYPFLVTVGALL